MFRVSLVRTASRIIVAAVIAGCSSPGEPVPTGTHTAAPPPPPAPISPGSVEIVVNVLSAPYPQDGGSVSILRTDSVGQMPPPIAPVLFAATEGYYTIVKVPQGAYTLTYTPPSGCTLVAGNSSTDIVVTSGATTLVTYDVTP